MKQLLSLLAILLVAAAFFTIVWNPGTAQGQGYPGPTAYPGPATNTPAPTAAATATATVPPIMSATPDCNPCQPTNVELAYASARPQTPPIVIMLIVTLCAAAFTLGLAFGKG